MLRAITRMGGLLSQQVWHIRDVLHWTRFSIYCVIPLARSASSGVAGQEDS